jgi:glycosyltransferase involved in cell wall biosynthesis
MKVSICLTVFNEGDTIVPLLESLLSQTKKPDEIIIIDGGSKDKTIEILKHFQKRSRDIKLLLEKCSRAEGRNLGVEIAKNPIIAITDAGCIADSDWLEKLTNPFIHPEVDIAAGFYKMKAETSMQKALSVFLGVTPSKFGIDFLPSTRSIAFRKEAWEKVGGFPEGKGNSAEDTDFNYKAVKAGLKFARVKSAVVEWGMPKTLGEGLNKLHLYAMWDARYGIWWHPIQQIASHNIRVILIFLRYILGISLLILGLKSPLLFWLGVFGLIFYVVWAFRKVYLEFSQLSVGAWGIVIQILSDFAVMAGFIRGTIGK